VFRKFYRNVSDYGLVHGLTKCGQYVVRPVYQHTDYRIYVLDVQHASVPDVIESPFQLRLLSTADTSAIGQVESMAEWFAGAISDLIRSGSVCVAALEDDRVVAFNLVSSGDVNIPVVDLRWHFKPTEAWSAHIATSKQFRNRGLGKSVRLKVIQTLQQRGVEWLYGGTLREHVATLKLAGRLGFLEIGDVRLRSRFGKTTWSYAEDQHGYARQIPSTFYGLNQLSPDQLPLQPAGHQT
jgi:GNAT superfamily N-acetyltransferase